MTDDDDNVDGSTEIVRRSSDCLHSTNIQTNVCGYKTKRPICTYLLL
jgi:hypothetical protein